MILIGSQSNRKDSPMAKSRSKRTRKRKVAPGRRRSSRRTVKRARTRARPRKATRRARPTARATRRHIPRAKRAKPAKTKRATKTRARPRRAAKARRGGGSRPRRAPALERERRSLRGEKWTAPFTTPASPLPAGPGPVTGGDADAQWTSLRGGDSSLEPESTEEQDLGEMLDFESPEPEPEE